jgi:hypothetical protein
VAVITLGRNAGEGSDRKVENDFTLSPVEQAVPARHSIAQTPFPSWETSVQRANRFREVLKSRFPYGKK